MSIFDEIKSDLKNGTPGPWEPSGSGRIFALFKTAQEESYFLEIANAAPTSFQSERDRVTHEAGGDRDANASRIARVPKLERIALAANELAEVAYLALSLIDQDNLEAKAGWDALDIAATTALTAFREATK